MSNISFPVNDLLRRKHETFLVIISLTLCVASTLFLFSFGEKIGFGISLAVQGRLTVGLSSVFSSFLLFVELLIFISGAGIISFMIFVMMSKRIKDFGLMKAIGCPNDLIFGFFMTELLTVAVVGCILGVLLGMVADFASASLFSSFGFQISQRTTNFWVAIVIFMLFLALALIFGAKPVLDTVKVKPIEAISPAYYLGLSKDPGFNIIPKTGFTITIALRSLFRLKSATIRIFLCLAVVFTLATVAIAGGVVADQTTKSWIEKSVGKGTVLIAHREMCDQYRLLLSRFYESQQDVQFNYSNESYSISEAFLDRMNLISGITKIDRRLVLTSHVNEVQGYELGETTDDTYVVGSDREGESLIVGVDPEELLSEWFLEGEFLKESEAQEAVIGDSLAQSLFSVPLAQSIKLCGERFDVIGICLDLINNGNVTYVPLKTLQNVSNVSDPNIIMIKIDVSANRADILGQMRTEVEKLDAEFEVSEVDDVLEQHLSYLANIWSTIMLLPLFSLVAASICLIVHVRLTLSMQYREFGILRALGMKPRMIFKIVSVQSLIVVLSSCGVGIPLGTIITLLILIPEPMVTSCALIEIACWLLAASLLLLISSLYPAARITRKPILEIMNQP